MGSSDRRWCRWGAPHGCDETILIFARRLSKGFTLSSAVPIRPRATTSAPRLAKARAMRVFWSLEPPLILRTRKLKVKRERNRERKKDRKKVQRGVQAPSGGAVDSQWQEAGAGGSGARGERLHADAVGESVPGATEAGGV